MKLPVQSMEYLPIPPTLLLQLMAAQELVQQRHSPSVCRVLPITTVMVLPTNYRQITMQHKVQLLVLLLILMMMAMAWPILLKRILAPILTERIRALTHSIQIPTVMEFVTVQTLFLQFVLQVRMLTRTVTAYLQLWLV